MENNYIIISILKNFLGEPRSESCAEKRIQWEFNCPTHKCSNDDHEKFNLSYNSEKKVFKCWKCGYKGFISKLINDYGTSEDKKAIKSILPSFVNLQHIDLYKRKKYDDYNLLTCKLPQNARPILEEKNTKNHQLAIDYLINKRKVSKSQIDKYRIKYTDFDSDKKCRIIFPSFNIRKIINYYEARTYLKNEKKTYIKPDIPNSNNIIFNEYFINWDLPIYLVEGYLDSLRIPNSIPLLGKSPSFLLINKILSYNSKTILALDSDAINDNYQIYNQLSSLGINIFCLNLFGKKDPSKIFEEYGQKGINEILATENKIDFENVINELLKNN